MSGLPASDSPVHPKQADNQAGQHMAPELDRERGKRPWYKRYGSDFIAGTMGLTLEEKGAYSLLIDLMHDRGGPIDDDARFLAGVCGCSARRWRTIRDALIARGKIEVVDGKLTNKRVEKDLEKAANLARELSENGRIGGEKSAERRGRSRKNNDLAEAGLKPTRASQMPDAKARKDQDRTKTESSPDTAFTHSEPNGSDAKAASPARQVSVGADLFGGVIEAPRRQAVVIPFDRTAAAVGKSPAPVPVVIEAKAETPAVAPTEPKSGNPMKDALWRVGKAYLASCDVPAAKAGQMIGKWLKTLRDDHGALLTILVKAEEIRPVDPISWISGAVSSRVRKSEAEPERKLVNGVAYIRDPGNPTKWIQDLGW